MRVYRRAEAACPDPMAMYLLRNSSDSDCVNSMVKNILDALGGDQFFKILLEMDCLLGHFTFSVSVFMVLIRRIKTQACTKNIVIEELLLFCITEAKSGAHLEPMHRHTKVFHF